MPGLALPCKFRDLVQIKIKIRKHIRLVDDHCAAALKDERVFERLVVALGNRKNHQIQMCAGVKFRRTDKIADILQNDEIQSLRTKLLQTLAGHGGVEMAHAARVQLNDLRAGVRDGVRIDVGVDIRLHHAHAQRSLQQRQQAQQRRRLAGAGRGHQIDEISALRAQLGAKRRSLCVVIGKDALFDFDDAVTIHAIPPLFSV